MSNNGEQLKTRDRVEVVQLGVLNVAEAIASLGVGGSNNKNVEYLYPMSTGEYSPDIPISEDTSKIVDLEITDLAELAMRNTEHEIK